MNNFLRKILLFVCGIALTASAYAQGNNAALEDIVNNLKASRVSGITRYFDSSVPITINNNQQVYSKSQAEIVLQDFFSRNNPKDMKVTESGSPNNTTRFAICTFSAAAGKYSIYILLKQKDGSFMLQEIRISKE